MMTASPITIRLRSITRRTFEKTKKIKRKEAHERNVTQLCDKFTKESNWFWKSIGGQRKSGIEMQIEYTSMLDF